MIEIANEIDVVLDHTPYDLFTPDRQAEMILALRKDHPGFLYSTSGGGALVNDDVDYAARSRFLATQARYPAPHYEHSELGFNYRMSNLLAAVGRAQLADLARRVGIDPVLNKQWAEPKSLNHKKDRSGL